MSNPIKMLLRTALMAVAVSAFSNMAIAGQPAEPGKGPPDCPGTPGAFISSAAKEIKESGTPPGQVVKDLAQANNGVGGLVRDALTNDCGIGALPPPA